MVQTMDNIALQHLYGYGLIENNGGNLTICFDTIKHFLQGKYKFERKNLSIKEQKLEISVRFDAAEQKLRAIVRNTLRTSLGNEGARTAFLKAMEGNKAVAEGVLKKANKLTYKQLFDPTMNGGCFFTVLIDVLEQNYSLFKNVFETDLNTALSKLRRLNKARQLPSHSASENVENWTNQNFEEFREAMVWLEKILENYG